MTRIVGLLLATLLVAGCSNEAADFRDKCVAAGGHAYRIESSSALVPGTALCLTDDGRVIEIPVP